MAYDAKTKETAADVRAYIDTLEPNRRREEALTLLDLFAEVSGEPARLWGDSIIGFGRYRYVYASGHSGEAAKVGFSPQKTRHSLYLMPYAENRRAYLARLGKVKSGVACVYVNRLSDIDLDVLREMVSETIRLVDAKYPPENA